MLKQQHPVVGGLQSTTLAKSFAMEPQTGEFVQILNINDNHWIAVSTIGCQPSTINVYDSLHGYLPKHEQKVVADIMMSPLPYHTSHVCFESSIDVSAVRQSTVKVRVKHKDIYIRKRKQNIIIIMLMQGNISPCINQCLSYSNPRRLEQFISY